MSIVSRNGSLSLICLAVLAELGLCAREALPAQLPVPCAAGACGVAGPSTWVTSGQATAVQAASTLTVNQSTDKAVLNWASFDIGADGKVIFKQPSATSIALNRIFSANPTSIFGQLTANGQIYLLNTNGILFGKSAQVNVGGLIASSLNITDSRFQAGLLPPNIVLNPLPSLDQYLDPSDPSGKTYLTNTGAITVQQGAQLNAAAGGRLLLAAPTVQNAGSLQAPDGQIILAAGQKVYLQSSSDPSLRGLLVEVDSKGVVENQLTGQLSAARGNISLVGLAVNQDGRISATTTVSANGSVRLEAGNTGDSHQVAFFNGKTLESSNGGTITLGPDSHIDVLPELTDTATAVDQQAQLPSTVNLIGQAVIMQGGEITAPGGNLTITASANPSAGVVTNGNANARIRIDPGASIDVSGSNAELPMAANLVTVQLRANEFADDPTQRNGALRGRTVIIDARVGTAEQFANVSGAIAAVPRNVAQRTSRGGSVIMESEGDVVVAKGSTINVSGGAVTYDGGQIQTTQLVGADGRLYDVGAANPLLTYTGVVNPTFTQTFDKWGVQEVLPTPGSSHYESGYVEGNAAGTVQVAAPNIVLNGTLLGRVTNGALQRTPNTAVSLDPTLFGPPNGAVPGGRLIIGLPNGLSSVSAGNPPDYLSPSVSFAAQPPVIVVSDEASLPGPLTLQLPVSYLTSGGFTRTEIYSNTQVALPAGLSLDLTAGGSLLVKAPQIDVKSNITALDGKILLNSVQTAFSPNPATSRAGITIHDGVTLDVSGQWTNDFLAIDTGNSLSGPSWKDGGVIQLKLDGPISGPDPEQLVLGNNVSLLANGGAWVNSSGTIAPGAGGSIELNAGSVNSAVSLGSGIQLAGFGVVGAHGGQFSFTAPRMTISQGSSDWTQAQSVDDFLGTGNAIQLYAPLFSQYGFSSVSLTASGTLKANSSSLDALTVTSGTTIRAQASSLQLNSDFSAHSSGGTVAGFASPVMLPDYSRPAVNVALAVIPAPGSPSQIVPLGTTIYGLLDIQAGASIQADPGASISLKGAGSILVDGSLRAPGGNVSLQILGLYDGPNLFSPGSFDPGYLPSQRIELGTDAYIDVGGYTLMTPNDSGLLLGGVMGAGTVSLFADRGYLVTGPGSQINISGVSDTVDLPDSTSFTGYTRHTVGSAGGLLSVRSSESISLLGSLLGKAGTGDNGQAPAGALSVLMSRVGAFFAVNASAAANPFPTTPLTIQLVGDNRTQGVYPPDTGEAAIGVAGLMASGIDSISLKADNAIQFATGAPLALARSINLDAPVFDVIGASHASLSAPVITLGNSATAANISSPTSGLGSLSVSGHFIEVFGSSVFQESGKVLLSSSGDVQLRGVVSNNLSKGSLAVGGDLEVDAARIYPTTATSFVLSSPAGVGGTILFGQTAASPGTPWSVAGSLNVTADNIVQAGTVIAPFGNINFAAGTSIKLASGSLTSVSAGDLLLPYSSTQLGGKQWLDPVSLQPITAIPTREVTIAAPSVTFAKNATIDLHGGGDLYSYEWVPGTGGSADALGPSAIPALYAVLPSMLGQYGPYDYAYFNGTGITPGQSVYLSGIAGLAAGVYPLLPARYALLPGAFLVQSAAGFQNIAPGEASSLADGSSVVAGYFTFGDTGLRTPGYSGFSVRPGIYGRSLASYQDTAASTFFAALGQQTQVTQASTQAATHVNLPADAGQLSFLIGNSLYADSQSIVKSAAAKGGRGAEIDISATNLDLVGNSGTTVPDGHVSVLASLVQSWTPGDLVLGGHAAADGSIGVVSNSVTVGAGAALSADQIIVVAGQAIDVQKGASLTSSSGADGTAPAAGVPKTESVKLTGSLASGAALLAVSDLSLPTPVRPAPDQSATPATGASLTLESGSNLSSLGAISVDAPNSVQLAGSINGKGASWSLGSNSIAFVGSAASTDTLQIGTAALSELQQASAVRLASGGSIDLMVPVTLGTSSPTAAPVFNALTLIAAQLNNQAHADSVIGAKTVTLQGLTSAAPSAPTAGFNTLSLVAGELDIGAGTLSVNGFAQTEAQVAGAVVGHGAGTLSVQGNLGLTAQQITAGDGTIDPLTAPEGAKTQISAPNGTLTISAQSAHSATALPSFLGGDLTLQAKTINDGGSVVATGGRITLNATQDFTATSGSVIDAGGVLVSAGGRSVGAPGGVVSINAGRNLNLSDATIVNVSAAGDAAAGTLDLVAGGSATIGAQLRGGAASGKDGGRFALDAGQLTGSFTTLSNNLQAGGFNREIDVRARTGDLLVNAGGQTMANQVILAADTGNVTVAGVISAPSAGERGQIRLFGAQGVTLASTGELHADTSAGAGRGGTIELGTGRLGTTPGVIDLKAGSIISAKGSAQSGDLLLRAPALANNDVSISELKSDLSGVGRVVIEPVLTFQGDVNHLIDFGVVQNQVTNYMGAAGSIIGPRLTVQNSVPFVIQPGVEIQHTGDFILNQALDLSSAGWRFNGQPVDLTVRATGKVDLASSVSDGFSIGTIIVNGRLVQVPTLLAGPSASLRFVAGADLTGANPLAVTGGAGADLVVEPGTVLRTGTGEIDLIAAGNIKLGDATASVYTAGTPGMPSLQVPRSNPVFSFPTDGGNLVVRAGGDIIGAPVSQAVSLWQLRQGNANNAAQWGVDLKQFGWNFGTLGGGDVVMSAGGNVVGVTVAAADSLYARADGGQTYFSSGAMDLSAQHDVTGSQFFVAHGRGSLTARGSFLDSLINMGDAQLQIQARQDISIDGVLNPTLLPQAAANGTLKKRLGGAFFTYGGDSSLDIRSTSGTVTLQTNTVKLGPFLGSVVQDDILYANPASLSVSALVDDIKLSMDGATLYPADTGELSLFAGRDILGTTSGVLGMSDVPASDVPTALNPGLGDAASAVHSISPPAAGKGSGRHAGDPQPVLITAGRDISNLQLDVPKPSQLIAGRDITDLRFTGQNLATTDETLISAGRDFIEIGIGNQAQLGGPGRLDLLAGRNVDLGFSLGGLTTVGNTLNPNLPTAQGADLTVYAGLGQQPDFTDFFTKIVAPSAAYQQQLVSYVESRGAQTGLSVPEAEAAFKSFGSDKQRPFIDTVFFNELVTSGREANTAAGAGFKRGYAAIDALFPNSRTVAGATTSDPFQGDLTLEFSRIYTLNGGSISLLVPGGLLNVGLANPPASTSARDATQLGIVAQGRGDVSIYTKGDVLVNSSRIFTLLGGNIAIWSNEGSIDAGRGAKSSISAPPPQVTVDAAGNVRVTLNGAAAGSGIRTIQTEPGVNPGNVDLIAPVGSVNAGDAGIGAAGNINIAAQTVIGLDNINFGGSSTGVPAQVSSLGASLSAVSSTGAGATTEAANAAGSAAERKDASPLAQAAIGWLDVFVTGLGEDACKPDDIECLKRQK